ncbi:MAG: hypothetical protein WAM14_21890 [Candidatus Nitrosopolaris sp.]
MTNILAGYLQSLGADMYHATIQTASHSLIPVLQSIVIIGVISGIGLILYDVFRKKGPNVKELAKEVKKQQDKENLDQIDRQENHRKRTV